MIAGWYPDGWANPGLLSAALGAVVEVIGQAAVLAGGNARKGSGIQMGKCTVPVAEFANEPGADRN